MLEKLPKMKNVFEKKEFVEEKIHQLIQKAKEFFSHAANYTIRDQKSDNSNETKENPLKTQAYKEIFRLIESGLAHSSYDLQLYSKGESEIKDLTEDLDIEEVGEEGHIVIGEAGQEIIGQIFKTIFGTKKELEQWEFLASLDDYLTNPELLETLPDSLQSALALQEIRSDEYQNNKSTVHYLLGIYFKEKAKKLGLLTIEDDKLKIANEEDDDTSEEEIQLNYSKIKKAAKIDIVPDIDWKEISEAVEKLYAKTKNSRRVYELEIDDDD